MRSAAILASSIRDIGASRAPFSAASDWEKNFSHAWRLRSPSAICAGVQSGGSPRFTGHHLTGRLTLLRLRAGRGPPRGGEPRGPHGGGGRATPGAQKADLEGSPPRVPVPAAPAVVE